MQNQQVKLVKSQNSSQQFQILLHKKVGQGGFGTVYQARSSSNPSQRLVAKIMKMQNQNKKKSIDKQLKIMSELPLHQNIVKVIPLKTYSNNNYYIFMQYCDGGTLYDIIQNKKSNGIVFTEEELYDLFYQCMSGYKVLFDKKILHQDIKAGNILVKNGVYKLADFGLSVFYQGHDFGTSREGTFTYIAPQKLTVLNYVGNPKSDVYSFGVLFYEIITGHHPYFTAPRQTKDYRAMRKQLCEAKLIIPKITGKYSLKFQNFLDLVLLMVKKIEKNRISFQEVYEMTQTGDIFSDARKKQKQVTKQFFVEQYDFVVTQFSNILTLPFDISAQEEEEMKKKFQKSVMEKGDKMVELGKEIANYFIKNRLIVYYLDRLARKLSVQQSKMEEKYQLYDRVILNLTLLIKSLLRGLVDELRAPKYFSIQSYICFKRTHELAKQIISLLQRDHKYVEDCLEDLLYQPTTLSKNQIKQTVQLYKQHKEAEIVKKLLQSLKQLLIEKTSLIEVSNKVHLVTLANILTIIEMLENFDRSTIEVERLQVSDRKIMMSTGMELVGLIEGRCSEKGLICGFDMTGVYEDDEAIVFQENEPEEND